MAFEQVGSAAARGSPRAPTASLVPAIQRGADAAMTQTSRPQAGGPTRDAASHAGRLGGLRLATVLLLMAGSAVSAHAQMGMGGGQMGGGRGGRHQGQQQQQQAAPPPPPVVPEPWPRLDSGAILCKSQDDLARYQAQAVADPDAGVPGPAPDCHLIQQRVAIRILERNGLSHAHVVTTDKTAQSGWTNAYLPVAAPPSGAPARAASAGR